MISVGNNKAVICKGDFRPAQLYKGDKKITGYSLEEFTGTDGVTLENCYNDKVYDAYLHGKNLLDVRKAYPNYANDEGGITYGGRDALWDIYNATMYDRWKENTRYTLSANYEVINADNNRVNLQVYYTDGTNEGFWDELGGMVTGSKSGYGRMTTKAGKTVQKMVIAFSTGARALEVKLTNMQLEEGATATEYEPPCRDATITVRGKNYFDLNKVPFNESTTKPYKNGLIAQKTPTDNRGVKMPVSLPKDKTVYFSLDVVDYEINGTIKRVSIGFFDGSGGTSIHSVNVSATLGHKSYSFTTSKNIAYIQTVFQADDARNADGDYVTVDNIMIRTEGDDTFELYIEPQTIPFENGEPTKDIPTFRGTTVIEVESDVPATISGKYKRAEG